MTPTWIDRAVGYFAPDRALRRVRARAAMEMLARHYEAAAGGRRTQGWRRSIADANLAVGPALARLRDQARDLVRNNPYAESALSTIADHTVGWGIVGKPAVKNEPAAAAWKAWAESTDCDADGRHDFYGLQKMVMRTVVESGEVLIRRRLRRPEDGLSLPMQVQILDPDYLDITHDSQGSLQSLQPGMPLDIQGVRFDPIGRRVGYWLFDNHPGSAVRSLTSKLVPAESVLHVFKPSRPGQVRAASWFAPVLLRFRDFDEFEDATLMKQKIAACLAVIKTDVNGGNLPLGSTSADHPDWDMLSPGAIIPATGGESIEVVQPPRVNEYPDYTRTVLRAIATGLGVTYEDLTGDYQDMPFSAARMSRLRHEARIRDWRWRLLIPQFCDPVWSWVMQTAVIAGQVQGAPPLAKWTPPPMDMVNPESEGLAEQRLIRTGLKSWSEAVRERGYDPDELLAEMVSDNAKFDANSIVLDCDARQTTQHGQIQQGEVAPVDPAAPPKAPARVVSATGWSRR